MERESGEKMTTIGGDGGRGRSIGARGRSVGARGRSVVARGRSAGGVRGRSVAVRARSVVEGAIARGRGRSLGRGGSRGVARGRGRSLGRRGFHARGRSPTPEARSMSAGTSFDSYFTAIMIHLGLCLFFVNQFMHLRLGVKLESDDVWG